MSRPPSRLGQLPVGQLDQVIAVSILSQQTAKTSASRWIVVLDVESSWKTIVTPIVNKNIVDVSCLL